MSFNYNLPTLLYPTVFVYPMSYARQPRVTAQLVRRLSILQCGIVYLVIYFIYKLIIRLMSGFILLKKIIISSVRKHNLLLFL